MCMSVTVEGFRIDDGIYLILLVTTLYNSLLHTHIHYCPQSPLHKPLLGSGSVTSFSQQQLTTIEPQQFSNSPTNQLNCPAYNILSYCGSPEFWVRRPSVLADIIQGFASVFPGKYRIIKKNDHDRFLSHS
jgi:hypothetical protein